MPDKTAILEKFNNDKLIDVVKNYKQYGYDDAIRNTALAILRERGIDKSFLEMTGNLHNSKFEFAEDLYNSYTRNSTIAFILYALSLVMAFMLFGQFKNDSAIMFYLVLRIIFLLGFIVFFIQSLMKQNEFNKSIGKESGSWDVIIYILLGLPLYIIIYFIQKKQMAEEMKLIK